MKNKTRAILNVLLIIIFTFSLGAMAACKDKKPVSGPVEVMGLEVEDEITVNQGNRVLLEKMFVTDSSGQMLSVVTGVTTAAGGYVPVDAGEFVADDENGYVITYSVLTSDGVLHEVKTRVKVIPSAAGNISAIYEKSVHCGDENRIVPVYEGNPGISYKVVKNSDKSEVAVSEDGVWVAERKGLYTVTVEADYGNKKSEFSYGVFAREFVDNLVENFDETWEERSRLFNDKRSNWSYVTSADCGIKDRNGEDGEFLSLTTSETWPAIYFTPLESKEYYEQLLEEGYEDVLFYVYMDSEKGITHATGINQDVHGTAYYTKAGPNLHNRTWNAITMKLSGGGVTEYDRFDKGLIELYDALKYQKMTFMDINNGNNPAGSGDTMTFYMSDIYVVKNVDIKTFAPDRLFKKGESIDVKSLFGFSEDLKYYVQDDAGRRRIEGEYTFEKDGDYIFSACPEKPYYNGGAIVSISVKPRTLATKLIDLSAGKNIVDINEYADVAAVIQENEGWELSCWMTSKYGERPVPAEGGRFDANGLEDGIYYLKYFGTKDGEEELRFIVPVDIYDGEKPVEVESFAHSDSSYAVRAYYVLESAQITRALAPSALLAPNEYMELDFNNPEHGLSIEKMDLPTEDQDLSKPGEIYDDLKDAYYLGVDESKFTAESPMPVGNIQWHWVDGNGADLYIYVLPRHSKEYYELYAKRGGYGKYAFAYTGGNDNSEFGNGQGFGYVSTIDDAGNIGFVESYMTWNEWVYTSVSTGDKERPERVTELTLDGFIEHYDDFANGRIWSFKLIKPAFKYTVRTARMFGITFINKNKEIWLDPHQDWGM